MRPVPLADLSEVDLSKEVVDMGEFRKYVLQRGRMALLDGVLHQDVEGCLIVGYKDVKEDEWWCSDHIPGRPIYPGALMIETAAQLSTFDFVMRRPEIRHKFVGFTGIDKVRFRATVEPGVRLIVVSRAGRLRKNLFHYKVQSLIEDKIVFEGEINGMVV